MERELIDYFLIKACNASIVAGEQIMKLYEDTKEFDVNIKSDNTIITEADRVSHEIIKQYLSQTRIPMLSEEGRDMLFEERYRWDLYWLVDPLDGTREFVNRNGEFVISIALMSENKPAFGVIYIPPQHKLYFSDPDRGAFCIDDTRTLGEEELSINRLFPVSRKLEREPWKEGTPLRVAVTRSHMNDETRAFIDKLKERYENVEVTQYGSAMKFCHIADDKADMYVRFSDLFDWHIAAGEALLRAVGAGIKHIGGEEITYNKVQLIIHPFIATFDSVTY